MKIIPIVPRVTFYVFLIKIIGNKKALGARAFRKEDL
jgi:hypothetical protein